MCTPSVRSVRVPAMDSRIVLVPAARGVATGGKVARSSSYAALKGRSGPDPKKKCFRVLRSCQ
jgi:hypothetical protein